MADDSKDVCRVEGVIAGAAKGQDVVNKFNQDCSPAERSAFFNNLQSQGTSTDNSRMGTHAASMLGGFKIEYDSVKRTLDDVHRPGAPNVTPADAHVAGKAGPKAGHDGARKPEAKPQAAEVDHGRRGIDDWYTKASRQNLSPDEKTLAGKVEKALLNGDSVSASLNDLGRDAKVRVMAEVKGHLAEQAGTKVVVSEGDGADGGRSILMETKGGQKILIDESKMGIPRDINVNTGSMLSKLTGARDVYDAPGEVKASASSSSGFNLRDALLGKENLTDGNGPLARMLRQEPVSDAEMAEMKRKGLVFDAKDRSQ